jgi:hypothetical protein
MLTNQRRITMSKQIKERRESMRWLILLTLSISIPIGASEELLLFTIQQAYHDVTALDIRRELDFLAGHSLVHIHKMLDKRRLANLTLEGLGVIENRYPPLSTKDKRAVARSAA